MKNSDFSELNNILPEDGYDFLECLSEKEDSLTLLARKKAEDLLLVVKLYPAGTLLYDFSLPEEIRNLKHPSVPLFLEEGKNEKYRYEIRAFVPGTPLSGIGQSLSEEEVLSLGMKLCDILSYLHSLPDPVIHRDIKPANVVRNEAGDVFLIDFGIARTFRSRPEEADTIVCGTREFCSPEQFGFMQTDARSDLFSLGKLLGWLCPEPSKELAGIIGKCTRFDPAARFQTAAQVKQALFCLTKEQKKKKRHLLITAAVLLLITVLTVICVEVTKVRFTEPLVKEAVLNALNRPGWLPVFPEDLEKVTELYIVGEESFSTEEAFYKTLDEWYARNLIPEGSLASLSDLASMQNLTKLCIAGECITDLSPVEGLAGLEKLELKHNRITDISPLKNLQNLSSVGLNGNPVTDLDALTSLPSLKYLDLCEVNGYDETVFLSLDCLEYLDIDNRTQSYRYLSGKTIRRLRLGSVFTGDLSFLLEINGLEEVRLTTSTDHYRLIQKLGDVPFTVVYE